MCCQKGLMEHTFLRFKLAGRLNIFIKHSGFKTDELDAAVMNGECSGPDLAL